VSTFKITSWHGDRIASDTRKATQQGIDETTQAAVLMAQEMAPRDTGFMASTIEAQPAVVESGRVVGRWGNWTALYTLWQEIGARGRTGRYFLRRAADAEYPNLAARIKSRMRG
jgi:hypothetical protein